MDHPYRQHPVVFKCPATGVTVILPIRINSAAATRYSSEPFHIPCFCGDAHIVQMPKLVERRLKAAAEQGR